MRSIKLIVSISALILLWNCAKYSESVSTENDSDASSATAVDTTFSDTAAASPFGAHATDTPSNSDGERTNEKITTTADPKYVDTLQVKKDEPPQLQLMKGTAVVYAPQVLIEGNDNTVIAILSKEKIVEKLRSNVIQIIADENGTEPKKIKEEDIHKKSVMLYNKMRTKLIFDKDVFDTIPINNNKIKEFNKESQLTWTWTLKPKKTASHKQLIFVFESLDNNKKISFEEHITVNVAVAVEDGIKGFLSYLFSKPEYTIPTILVPLITFLAGRFFRKKNENDQKP